MFTLEESFSSQAKIKVVGVGGAGGNAINRMVEEGMEHVEFVAINTDAQDLERSRASCRIQVGERVTKGLGAGARPDVGAKALEEDRNVVKEKLEGADMVFITAGMGGGTGSGGAPIVAALAREMDILTVGIVTRPFLFEGPQRMRNAEMAIQEMRKYVDTIIVIPNQRLLSMIDKSTPMVEAFRKVDDVLYHATRGISDLINVNGLINIDFADAVTVMKGMGDALMGTGIATGEAMARSAAEIAIHSPLLEDVSIKGARGVLINITGGSDMPLHDVSEVSSFIYENIGQETDVNIIVGAVIDPNMQGQIRVTVIATGFNRGLQQEALPKREQEKIAENVSYIARKAKGSSVSTAPAMDNRLPLFEAPKVEAPAPAAQRAPEMADEELGHTEAIERMISDVEKGIEIADQAPAPAAEPLIEPAERPEPSEALYEGVKKEMEADREKKTDRENRIQRFNTIKDLTTEEDFRSLINTPSIKNVSEKLCKSMKRDQFGLKNGITSHETDNLDVPTFLRQQQD